MPFLALDDSQEFRNLSKIWIYAVASIVSTAVTFLISVALSEYLIGLGSQSIKLPGEDVLFNNDTHVLEPKHHIQPGPKEIIQQVIATLNKGDNNEAISRPSMVEHEDSEITDPNRSEG